MPVVLPGRETVGVLVGLDVLNLFMQPAQDRLPVPCQDGTDKAEEGTHGGRSCPAVLNDTIREYGRKDGGTDGRFAISHRD